ncbi:hypothetical protein F5Y15DRAFT_420424 [Xylariaceae sp. FL0016]|nr:hypothetical protein F5Y15DRAFT_420424 [Xylariaceae sp. FL0016]
MATTTIFPPPPSHESKPPTLPRLGVESEPNPDPQPAPGPKTSSKSSGAKPSNPDEEKTHRILSHAEWLQFCRGVGVLKDDESEEVVRPTSRLWPPNGFKDGLYQDVLTEKTKFNYWFHMLSTARWVLMLIQMAVSAVLTALGSVAVSNGVVITTLAAINTCIAGILALLHNSGLPDRYRSDRNEYIKVEEHVKQIIDTAIVPAEQNICDVLAICYDMLQDAKDTVQKNIPASYTPSASATPVRASMQMPSKK